MIGVNVLGSEPKKLKEVMEKEKLTWRSYADTGPIGRGPIAVQWNHGSTPTLYLLDHRGVIRRKWIGAPGGAAIDAAIETLLREVEGQRPERESSK